MKVSFDQVQAASNAYQTAKLQLINFEFELDQQYYNNPDDQEPEAMLQKHVQLQEAEAQALKTYNDLNAAHTAEGVLIGMYRSN